MFNYLIFKLKILFCQHRHYTNVYPELIQGYVNWNKWYNVPEDSYTQQRCLGCNKIIFVEEDE